MENFQKRIYMQEVSTAHSPQNVALGTLILWLGWLLFNGGSSGGITGAAGESSELIIANTIIAPSIAGIVTFFIKPFMCPSKEDVLFDFQGITNGILAGLVSITAGCDVMDTWAAFCVGIIGAFVYCLGVMLMNKLKIDDPLEASQVHGFCGIWGCLAIPFFKKEYGIFYGHPDSGKLLGYQIVGCLAIAAWSAGLSAIFFLIASKMGYFRLTEKDELIGGDLHYFGPRELDTSLANLDIRTGVMHAISASAKREMEEGGDFEMARMAYQSPANSGQVLPVTMQA